MKNPHVIWAAVTIVFFLVAGAVALVALDKDVTVILSLAGLVAVPVLGAFGAAMYQKMDQVKEASNGNMERWVQLQQETQRHQQETQRQLTVLALSMNPNTALTSLEKEDPNPGGQHEGVRNPG